MTSINFFSLEGEMKPIKTVFASQKKILRFSQNPKNDIYLRSESFYREKMHLNCHSLQSHLSSLILLLLCMILSGDCAECPSSDALEPCKCREDHVIVCDGNHFYNLKWVFEKISAELHDSYDKNFKEFVLSNTAITDLEDSVFGNVTFKRITIKDASSLRKIASNAFRGNTRTVEEFHQIGESMLGDEKYIDELFDALSSLVRAKKIWLDRNQLKMIASVGFGKIPGLNSQLIDLNFNKNGMKSGMIRTIGNYAFYFLNRLKYLYLSHQQIDYLPSNAFDFEKRSNTTLFIYMGNNRLNNTSFETGIFLNAKRPIQLELYWNNALTYLDEKIFIPFLRMDKRNAIRLIDNPLECDCKSYWIVRDKDRFRNQILNAKCKVGPKLFNIDLITFDQCKTPTQIRRNNNPYRISVSVV